MIQTLLNIGRETIISTWVESKIKDYALLKRLSIDPKRKIILLEGVMHGERLPTRVFVRGYKITTKGDSAFLSFEEIETSRPWLNTFMERYIHLIIEDKKLEFPSKIYKTLSYKLI